ncbi:MAG: M56 family metallopeptidase [Verrucomicrobiales bacterium]|nr:M56 family metallopeptidase [Verrucomicrobiales bacterium]
MSALEWVTEAGRWTLQNSISATLLFLFIWLCIRVMRGALSPRLRMALLILVGARLFLPFAPESKWSVDNLVPTKSFVSPATSYDPTPITGKREATEAATQSDNSLPIETSLALLWISVSTAIFLCAVLQQALAGRKIRGFKEIRDPALLASIRECGIPHSVKVVETPDQRTIAVFGSLRVTDLILPENFTTRYSRKEIHGILRHESEHICGNDLLWNWLVFTIQCWHWFNPFVWIAGKQWRSERELICDHAALHNRSITDRQSYGEALIKSVQPERQLTPAHPAFVPFFRHQSELKYRLQLIMKNKSYQLLPQLGTLAITLAFAIATFTTAITPTVIADDKGGVKKPDEPGKKVNGDPGGKKPEGDKAAAPKVDNSKEAKVFRAYDKNSDSFVDDTEMEAMMEGKQNSRGRREIRKAIDRADLNNDQKLDMKEFAWWYTIGRRDERAEIDN